MIGRVSGVLAFAVTAAAWAAPPGLMDVPAIKADLDALLASAPASPPSAA
jgi:hypothetical protein